MSFGLKVYSDVGNVTVDGDYQMMVLLAEGSVTTTASPTWTTITLPDPINVDDAPLLFARLSDQSKWFGPLFVSVSSGEVTGFTIPVESAGLTLYWRVYVRRSNADISAPSGYGIAVYDADGQVALDSSQAPGLIAFQDTLALPSPKTSGNSASISHSISDAFICLNPFKELFAVPAGLPGLILIQALLCKVEDTAVTILYGTITTFSGSPGYISKVYDPIPIILMSS